MWTGAKTGVPVGLRSTTLYGKERYGWWKHLSSTDVMSTKATIDFIHSVWLQDSRVWTLERFVLKAQTDLLIDG